MMEGVAAGGVQQAQQQQPQPQPQVERLNEALQQQLNLEQVKTRAVSLFKAISRILEIIDVTARANAVPKWEAVLGQFSMVNLELFNIVDDIKKVSKAFVVYPKNVNAENANVLPVMLSSKLLPEMETDDNSKREHLLHGMQNLPISAQIDKLKTRIDMIAAACASAEKILADTRKTYGFGTRQGPAIASTLDKAQAAKIQEQENLLRAAVNLGEGLRVPPDQQQITSVLPLHLVDVLSTGDGAQSVTDTPGMYAKSTPPLSSNIMANQGALLQGSGAQLMGRSAASPSGPSFNNTTSPLPYANSPSSGTNMMNAPSPQQQTQQQQQQQRQRMQMPQHQQQILAQQQQFRQAAMPGMGQTQLPQLHDLQSQTQQKLQQLHGQHAMQFSQPLTQQQFQNRQMASGHVQNVMGQAQLSQGNPLSRQMNQFSAGANAALYNAAQTTPNSQMMTNISGAMPSQSQLPRMQPYALSGTNPPRSHASQMMNDQMFNMGSSNPAAMMQMQQQGAFGNMAANAQNLQAGMGAMQNTQQTHPNFQHQRPPNQ
uniref:Mediator of RNA polymerase II transcription subunit 8 n=1 Tax=Kalanchoe fedtschenkoi TaxID=63787 RepID=A0A7N0RGJ1_KALFE